MRSWKTFVFDAMFCRLATMGVANSRLLMLPNSEIRQNEGVGKASGFVRDAFGFGIYWDAKADLFLREFRCLPCCACCAWGMFLLSPHESMLRMCGGYVCTLSCVRFRFIIRFIVALPVEPWLSVQRCERTFLFKTCEYVVSINTCRKELFFRFYRSNCKPFASVIFICNINC